MVVSLTSCDMLRKKKQQGILNPSPQVIEFESIQVQRNQIFVLCAWIQDFESRLFLTKTKDYQTEKDVSKWQADTKVQHGGLLDDTRKARYFLHG